MRGYLVAAEHGRRIPGSVYALPSRHDSRDARKKIGASSNRTHSYAAVARPGRG